MELTAERFKGYPELARALLTKNIDLLRRLPVPFTSLLLREAIHYDWKFPMEQREVESNLTYLRSLPARDFDSIVKPFRDIELPAALISGNWVNDPVAFSEKLSAHLWATHQIDAFRAAAVNYMDRRTTAVPPATPVLPRLTYVMVGEGAMGAHPTLFRKLRPHGRYFSNINTTGALGTLLHSMSERVQRCSTSFAHWYIDGGQPAHAPDGITAISYAELKPVRALLQKELKSSYERRIGSEMMRSNLAQKTPEEFGLHSKGDAAVLDRFAISIFTEGSGTQIYSTTFVQWAAREALRRAQPLTMLVRFRPRQRERPMQELLAETQRAPTLDPEGSLVDGEMGAYYCWINGQRLPGADRASFVAVFEGGRQAIAIGPEVKKDTTSDVDISLAEIVRMLNRPDA